MSEIHISDDKLTLHFVPNNVLRFYSFGVFLFIFFLTFLLASTEKHITISIIMFIFLCVIPLFNSREIKMELKNNSFDLKKSGPLGLKIFTFQYNCTLTSGHSFVLCRSTGRDRDSFYITLETPEWERFVFTENFQHLDEAMKTFDALKNHNKSDAKFIYGK